jgi:enamine deaminase RidA (YjgF/YER057c/UK114 family)
MGNVVRDILDKQLLDRHRRKMGKVDGVIMELRDGKPPRLAFIEVGGMTLTRRLHPRLAHCVARWKRNWEAGRGLPYRIPWAKVRDIGIDVEVDVDAEKTPVLAWEKWVSKNIIQRIPGS